MLGAVNDLGCLWDLGLEIVLSLTIVRARILERGCALL